MTSASPPNALLSHSSNKQWVLTKEEFEGLVCCKEEGQVGGPSLEQEISMRYQATGTIRNLCAHLHLSQSTVATAQMLLHRFYLRASFVEYPQDQIVAVIVFIAAKVDEHPRKLGDIHDQLLKVLPSAKADQELESWRQRAMRLERRVLRILCFDLSLLQPHRLTLQLVKQLPQVPDELIPQVWQIIHDMLRTPLCILFTAPQLASAAIWLAAHERGDVALPSMDDGDANFAGCPMATVARIAAELKLYLSLRHAHRLPEHS